MVRVLSFVVLTAFFLSAELPKFEESGTIDVNGSPFNVIFPTPCAYDWDGDGKKDLLVGQFSSGKIHLLLNSGTDNAPVFSSKSFLQAGGADITLSGS